MTKNNDIYLFEGLSEEEKNSFLDSCEKKNISADEIILEQGTKSNDAAYYIVSGNAYVIIDDEKRAELSEGGIFGELALITREPRTATVIAKTDMLVLIFSREKFLETYKGSPNFQKIRTKIFERVQSNFYGVSK